MRRARQQRWRPTFLFFFYFLLYFFTLFFYSIFLLFFVHVFFDSGSEGIRGCLTFSLFTVFLLSSLFGLFFRLGIFFVLGFFLTRSFGHFEAMPGYKIYPSGLLRDS